jgi:hypothetical protein
MEGEVERLPKTDLNQRSAMMLFLFQDAIISRGWLGE